MSSLLDAVFITRNTARLLVKYTKNESRPTLRRIVYRHGFAYWTNSFAAVRWTLPGLDVPDESWIDLVAPQPNGSKNQKFDTDGNLAAWVKMAGSSSSWDLTDPERWKTTPMDVKYVQIEHLFHTPDAECSIGQVAFNPTLLADLMSIVTQGTHYPARIMPTDTNPLDPWWILADDETRVQAILCPMRADSGKPVTGPVEESEAEK